MTEAVCLANANLVLTETVLRGTLTIENGLITEIVEGEHLLLGAIDCQSDYVVPGRVELRTDNLERHIKPRPDVN